MKALVCISNFGLGQLDLLAQVVSAYAGLREYQNSVVLHTTVRVDNLDHPQLTQVLCDSSLQRDLAFQHRKLMIEAQDEYDLFIYSENDILMTEANLVAFCEESTSLSPNYVIGFLRFEQIHANDSKLESYLPDAHPTQPVLERKIILNGRRYFQPANRHQGCFILTREQLKKAIQTGRFARFIPGFELNLEAAASNVYFSMGLTKVIPYDRMDDLLLHHLSDKYVNLTDEPWASVQPHTVLSLKRFIHLAGPEWRANCSRLQ